MNAARDIAGLETDAGVGSTRHRRPYRRLLPALSCWLPMQSVSRLNWQRFARLVFAFSKQARPAMQLVGHRGSRANGKTVLGVKEWRRVDLNH